MTSPIRMAAAAAEPTPIPIFAAGESSVGADAVSDAALAEAVVDPETGVVVDAVDVVDSEPPVDAASDDALVAVADCRVC